MIYKEDLDETLSKFNNLDESKKQHVQKILNKVRFKLFPGLKKSGKGKKQIFWWRVWYCSIVVFCFYVVSKLFYYFISGRFSLCEVDLVGFIESRQRRVKLLPCAFFFLIVLFFSLKLQRKKGKKGKRIKYRWKKWTKRYQKIQNVGVFPLFKYIVDKTFSKCLLSLLSTKSLNKKKKNSHRKEVVKSRKFQVFVKGMPGRTYGTLTRRVRFTTKVKSSKRR